MSAGNSTGGIERVFGHVSRVASQPRVSGVCEAERLSIFARGAFAASDLSGVDVAVSQSPRT